MVEDTIRRKRTSIRSILRVHLVRSVQPLCGLGNRIISYCRSLLSVTSCCLALVQPLPRRRRELLTYIFSLEVFVCMYIQPNCAPLSTTGFRACYNLSRRIFAEDLMSVLYLSPWLRSNAKNQYAYILTLTSLVTNGVSGNGADYFSYAPMRAGSWGCGKCFLSWWQGSDLPSLLWSLQSSIFNISEVVNRDLL